MPPTDTTPPAPVDQATLHWRRPGGPESDVEIAGLPSGEVLLRKAPLLGDGQPGEELNGALRKLEGALSAYDRSTADGEYKRLRDAALRLDRDVLGEEAESHEPDVSVAVYTVLEAMDPDPLRFTPTEWAAFLSGARDGEFNV